MIFIIRKLINNVRELQIKNVIINIKDNFVKDNNNNIFEINKINGGIAPNIKKPKIKCILIIGLIEMQDNKV